MMRRDGWRLFRGEDLEIFAADLSELGAFYNELQSAPNPMIVSFKICNHRIDEGSVRKLNAATEGVSEEFSAELAFEVFGSFI